jgi:hypothetical protein
MQGKIMTAEEFLEHIEENGKYTFDWKEFGILFAKYHVEQALKCASEEAESYVIGGLTSEVDKESILNTYPLKNIK